MVGVDCYGEYTSVLHLNEDYGARVLVSNCCLFVVCVSFGRSKK